MLKYEYVVKRKITLILAQMDLEKVGLFTLKIQMGLYLK